MTTPRAGRHFEPSAGHDEAAEDATRAFSMAELNQARQSGSYDRPSPQPSAPTPAAVPDPFSATPSSTGSAAAPVPGSAPSSLAGSGAASAPATPATPAPATPSGPINPLVAAREAAANVQDAPSAPRAGVTQAFAGVQPGQEVPMRSFDTSFGEGGHPRRTLLIVLIVILVIAAVAVGGFFIFRENVRTQATENINAAIQRLSDADAVIVPLDEAIGSEISSSTVSQGLTDAMLSSTTASNALTDAESRAKQAEQHRALLTEDQTQVIDAIKGSVTARRSMLEIGRTLLATDNEVSDALTSLDAAYASIESANAKVQQALDLSNAHFAAGDADSGVDLWAIVDLDNQAITDITNAQGSVAAAKEAFPDADYTSIETYLTTRLAELQVNLSFDTAMANGDEEGALAMNDQITQAADASTQAAANVPGTARDLVRDAYAVVTSGQSASYDEARSACASNDEVIRAYLGTNDDGTVPTLGPGESAGADALSAASDEGAGASDTGAAGDAGADGDAVDAGAAGEGGDAGAAGDAGSTDPAAAPTEGSTEPTDEAAPVAA